jgi:hypothetical protein
VLTQHPDLAPSAFADLDSLMPLYRSRNKLFFLAALKVNYATFNILRI